MSSVTFTRPLRCLAGLALLATLTACAGMGDRYSTPARAHQIPFTVEAITPELVGRLREAPPQVVDAPVGATIEDYAYRIGPSDVLSIFVNQSLYGDRAAATAVDRAAESQYVVSEFGDIFLPLHGPLRVAGLTVTEAYVRIQAALSRYIASPQINVRVLEYRSQRVAVAGYVGTPGYLPVTDRPMTITEAVIVSGVREDSNLRQVVLKRGGSEYLVDVHGLMQSPTFGRDWVLQDGDVVLVPPNENKVYVLGEAPNRSLTINRYSTSLAEMLVGSDNQRQSGRDSNYLQAGSARPGSIFVIRGTPEAAQVYHLNGKSPEAFILADRFQMQHGDIIYVSTRGVTRFNRFISQILPSLTSLVAPVFIADRLDNILN